MVPQEAIGCNVSIGAVLPPQVVSELSLDIPAEPLG
jgi:hypothetical protein